MAPIFHASLYPCPLSSNSTGSSHSDSGLGHGFDQGDISKIFKGLGNVGAFPITTLAFCHYHEKILN